MMADVVVIGGGIAGLSVAFELKRRGLNVLVLERQVRIGGKAVSEQFGGFLMEHGPSFVVAEAQILSLSRDLGIEHEQVMLTSALPRRYLVAHGVLRGLPIHPSAFLTSPYLSLRGRLRLLLEAFVPRRDDKQEETVAAFCGRRFGQEFTDRVIDPLVGGMFAGTAAKLSMAATFPRLVRMEQEHGSVVRAVVHSRKLGQRMPGRQLLSWRRGVGAVPAALARELAGSVKVGVAVRRIVARPQGFLVETVRSGSVAANAVVVATPQHVAAELLERIDPEAAAAAARIDAPPLAVVYLGYARDQISHPLDGLGYLSPSSEQRPVNGTLFCSSIFPGRAPEGFVSLAAYVGGDRAPAIARLPKDDLIALARSEFADLLGAKGDAVVARVRHWPRGLPQYRTGHLTIVDVLDKTRDRCPGLFITGNYLAGVSVTACAAHAMATALHVDAFLRSSGSVVSALQRAARQRVASTCSP